MAHSEKDQREGKFQPISPAPLENHAPVRGSIRGLEFPVRLVKQVFTNQEGSTGVIFLAGSDLSWDGEPMIAIYPKRWRMEEYHKLLQSNLGLEISPPRTGRTPCNPIFAALCAFTKLERLRMKHGRNPLALKYKRMLNAAPRARWERVRLAA